MTRLSEERRKTIEEWSERLTVAVDPGSLFGYALQALRDLLAESAGLRAEESNLRGERERLLGLLNHEERARLGYHGLECAFRRGGDCDCQTEQYRRAVASRNIVYGLVRDIAKAAGYDGDEEGYIPRLTEHVASLRAAQGEPPVGAAPGAATAADPRALLNALLAAAERWVKVDREWDADDNEMPIACDHPKEMHDGWGNEFDASRLDLAREVERVRAALTPAPASAPFDGDAPEATPAASPRVEPKG